MMSCEEGAREIPYAGYAVAVYGDDILNSDGMRVEDSCIQHGKTSARAHSVSVAKTCVRLSRALDLEVDERSLVRGALLHDYFLYDWHDGGIGGLKHALGHARVALANAERDFNLNDIERDMIVSHMFPLATSMPRTAEARVLCFVDKACTLAEVIDGLAAGKRGKTRSRA